MSAKLVQQQYVADVDRVLDERLPIIVNGAEKFATGLTKRTTVEDIIFAMMSVSDSSFKPENLGDYGIVEKWQGNERILDGKIKIYKLIRLWKSLPGDQLQHVQFLIKRRALAVRRSSVEAAAKKTESRNRFAFCTMSPALVKGWNVEKSQRKNAHIQRQLDSESESTSDVDSDLNSESGEDVDEHGNLANHKRYASIKRFNRSRKSSVKQIKKSFVELVNKQNEIIDKQLSQINETRSKSRSLKNKMANVNINASDIKEAFSADLSEKQVKEYSTLCKNYFKLQSCLDTKLEYMDTLKSELDQINGVANGNIVDKVNKKLQNKIDMSHIQTQKLNEVGVAISKIDDVISLKEKFIKSLELELQQLDSNEVTLNAKKSLASTSESARSSTSSTSSVFTSISSISTSQYANANIAHVNKGLAKFSYGDNESDTGISSANSEEFNSHLETLV